MHHDLDRPVLTALAQHATKGASCTDVVGAFVLRWERIDIALLPVIGRRGADALYQRSLHVNSASYPWLADAQSAAQSAWHMRALESALLQRSAGEAAAAGDALFQALHELLTSLIGGSLTERLLGSVWNTSPAAPTAQDTS